MSVKERAEWRDTPPCECSTDNYFTCYIYWSEVPMINERLRFAANVTRRLLSVVSLGLTAKVNGGIKDPTHEVITAEFVCENCGHNFDRSYEIGAKGKHCRDGSYGKIYGKREETAVRKTFQCIEDIYSSMPSEYGLINNNCSKWAGKFWEKI